jgi:hypothetical protein
MSSGSPAELRSNFERPSCIADRPMLGNVLKVREAFFLAELVWSIACQARLRFRVPLMNHRMQVRPVLGNQ